MGTIFYTAPVAPHVLINAFFLYSFLGWVMECIVIRREKGRWENRGFAHLPFCIIYGFGAMLGFALLRPFSGNYVLLYLVGAVLATLFEYLTARLMLRLFGTFWWDYTNKPFNYKGILCLESPLPRIRPTDGRAPATARMASTAFWIISFKAFPPFASGCFSARSESAG